MISSKWVVGRSSPLWRQTAILGRNLAVCPRKGLDLPTIHLELIISKMVYWSRKWQEFSLFASHYIFIDKPKSTYIEISTWGLKPVPGTNAVTSDVIRLGLQPWVSRCARDSVGRIAGVGTSCGHIETPTAGDRAYDLMRPSKYLKIKLMIKAHKS